MDGKVKKKGCPTRYKPEYCEMLVEHMSKGHSFESFASDISVHRDTLYEWCSVHEEFSDAKKIGSTKSLKELEKIGLDGMRGLIKGFNVAAWIFMCKNRHSDMFRDNVDLGQANQKPFILKYSLED